MIRKTVNKLYSLRSNPLAYGSFFMVGSSLLGNFLNYIFNVFVVRLLGPVNYGVFAALISLLTILSVPSSALTTAATKFTAGYKGEGNTGKIKTLFLILFKYLFVAGIITFAFITIFSSQIAKFLNISDLTSVILIGLSFLIIFPQTALNGLLQGMQSFTFISLNSIFSAVVKLIAGLGLVYLGFSVNGALMGFILALFLPFLASVFILKSYFSGDSGSIDWKSFLKYTPVAALTLLGLTFLITNDIILVKHYFSTFDAGIYSSLSLVGRVILFVSSPISVVMFPLIAERYSSKKSYYHYLFYSISLVTLASLSVTVFYFLFPEFSVNFFFGKKFLEAAPYLGFFGIFITLYSICNILVSFFLSVRKTKVAIFLIAAAALQWLLISLFHNNFWEVIGASVAALALLTLVLLLYLLLNDDFRNRARLSTREND